MDLIVSSPCWTRSDPTDSRSLLSFFRRISWYNDQRVWKWPEILQTFFWWKVEHIRAPFTALMSWRREKNLALTDAHNPPFTPVWAVILRAASYTVVSFLRCCFPPEAFWLLFSLLTLLNSSRWKHNSWRTVFWEVLIKWWAAPLPRENPAAALCGSVSLRLHAGVESVHIFVSIEFLAARLRRSH